MRIAFYEANTKFVQFFYRDAFPCCTIILIPGILIIKHVNLWMCLSAKSCHGLLTRDSNPWDIISKEIRETMFILDLQVNKESRVIVWFSFLIIRYQIMGTQKYMLKHKYSDLFLDPCNRSHCKIRAVSDFVFTISNTRHTSFSRFPRSKLVRQHSCILGPQ